MRQGPGAVGQRPAEQLNHCSLNDQDWTFDYEEKRPSYQTYILGE